MIMLKPILSNWAAEREEKREAINTQQRDGVTPSATLIPHSSLTFAAALYRCSNEAGRKEEIN